MLKKEKISELEDLVMEAIQYETQEKKKKIWNKWRVHQWVMGLLKAV